MEVFIHKKLIAIDHYQVHMSSMTFRKSLGQRSRSASDGRRNLANAIAPEPLNQNSQKHFLHSGLIMCPRSWIQRSRSQEHFVVEA